MTQSDRELEERIDDAAMRLQTAKTERQRRAAWEEMQRLIAQRSPARVREMERQKGLR